MSTSNVDTATALELREGALIAGRYIVQERIGTGGMGSVFRVLDKELDDQAVALKVLHPHLTENEHCYKRFRNEVRVARTLTHPNIVRIHDIGRDVSGFSYISMELVDGDSLKDLLQTVSDDGKVVPKALSVSEAANILLQILKGVSFAHDREVIHRDLKPANVLVNARGEVKLVDFGTARITGMENTVTQIGQLIGTPDYMSPEQVKGEVTDHQSDIYAMGVIAYEMVCGRRLFTGENHVAVAFKHVNEPIPPIESPLEEVPQWYSDLVVRSLAKSKEDRFASVHEMLTQVELGSNANIRGTFSLTGPRFGELRAKRNSSASKNLDPAILDEIRARKATGYRGTISIGMRRKSTKYRHRPRWAIAFGVLVASALLPIIAVLMSQPRRVQSAVTDESVSAVGTAIGKQGQLVAHPDTIAVDNRKVVGVGRDDDVGLKSGEPTVHNATVSTVDEETEMVPVAEKYYGVIRLGDAESDREFKMELEVSGSSVIGTARITGIGIYTVTGELQSRNIQLRLVRSGHVINLAGSQRGGSIKGEVTQPARNARGKWSVDLL